MQQARAPRSLGRRSETWYARPTFSTNKMHPNRLHLVDGNLELLTAALAGDGALVVLLGAPPFRGQALADYERTFRREKR